MEVKMKKKKKDDDADDPGPDHDPDALRVQNDQHAEAVHRSQKATSAIESRYWWVFGHVLSLLGNLIFAIDAFFEMCMCH